MLGLYEALKLGLVLPGPVGCAWELLHRCKVKPFCLNGLFSFTRGVTERDMMFFRFRSQSSVMDVLPQQQQVSR